MKRRNFFSRIFGMAAVVALAPQLCFRVRPAVPDIGQVMHDYEMRMFALQPKSFQDGLNEIFEEIFKVNPETRDHLVKHGYMG